MNGLSPGRSLEQNVSSDKLNRALAAHQSGKLAEAETLYQQCIRETDDFSAKQLLGVLYASQQRNDLAIPLMQSSLASRNDQPAVHNNLANCFKREGRVAEAAEHYRQALELNRDYVEAYRNYANLWLENGDFDRAERIAKNGLRSVPGEASLLNLLGMIQQRKQDFSAAITTFESALAAKPDYVAAAHNLAVTHRLNDSPGIALTGLKALRDQGVDGFEVIQNLGNAYSDLGDLESAAACYREVIEKNPTYADAHRNLSNILWSQDNTEGFLDSFESAFSRGVISDELVLTYFECLLRAERGQEVLDFLKARNVTDPWDARYCDLLGRTWLGLGDLNESHRFHERACSFDNAPPAYRVNFAIAKLMMSRLDEATAILEVVIEANPQNQSALSYLALCWRAAGDPRSQQLNDYEHLVQTFELGATDRVAFNRALDARLATLHNTKRHPLEQTLRGGTQTQGNLFARTEPEIVELTQYIREAVGGYLKALPAHTISSMGFDGVDQFRFSGSWSVRLRSEGYHTMHMHPMGSVSSAYYVSLPSVVAEDTADRAGWIQFGKPDLAFPYDFEAEYFVRPETGKLVLFPSYMWHGTVPFTAEEPRTTVAFDVVPAR